MSHAPHFNLSSTNDLDGLFLPLDHLGLIAVSGPDAADFLHNQLTNDVLKLGLDEARLAGYCSPKGRLLATFLMWRADADTVYLQCGKDLQTAMQKRLSMFVLRAKAKLVDATAAFQTFGLLGAKAQVFLQQHFEHLPEQTWQTVQGASGTLIRVSDSQSQARWLWLIPVNQAQSLIPAMSQAMKSVPPNAGSALWRWLEIAAGLPHITPATQDRFVPQMINFEALGGVNFKKGCYPGQEVVARSQYLGKLKRRMTIAHIDDLQDTEWPKAGDDVFEDAKPEEPIGTIVNIEASPMGGFDLLIEVPHTLIAAASAMADASNYLATTLLSGSGGTTEKRRINLRPLPYVLPDQEIFVRPKL